MPRRVLLLVLLVLLALPAAASATTYYAAPGDAGGGCTSPSDPCTLTSAVTAATQSGDAVSLAAGSYAVTSTLTPTPGVSLSGVSAQSTVIHGMTGTSEPTITLGQSSRVSDLSVDAAGEGIFWAATGSGDRIDVRAAGDACVQNAGLTLTNALCAGTGTLGSSNAGLRLNTNPTNQTAFITFEGHDVTIVGAETAVLFTANVGSIELDNTIAYARDQDATCPIDIRNDPTFMVASAFTSKSSNYPALGSTCRNANLSTDETAHQTDRPTLANPTGTPADYRETSTSPSRFSGNANDSSAGTVDLDQRQRVVESFVDIGAYEFIDPPEADADAPTGLTATGVTLNARVDNNGIQSTAEFRYGVGSSAEHHLDQGGQNGGNATTALHQALTGLTPGTTYKWRACVTTTYQTVCAPDTLRFTTPPAAPLVGAASAGGITDASATIKDGVNPGHGVTSVRVEYGTSTAYASTSGAQSLPAGDAAVPVSITLTGLAASTRYHARVVASNAGGGARSADVTFTTNPADGPPGGGGSGPTGPGGSTGGSGPGGATGGSGPGGGTGTTGPGGSGTGPGGQGGAGQPVGITPSTSTTGMTTPAPAGADGPITVTPPPVPGPITLHKAKSRHGTLTVTVEVPAAGLLSVKASYAKGKKTVGYATGKRTAKGPGTVTLRLTPGRAAKRRLHAKRKLTLKLAVTFAPAGAASQTRTGTVTVTR